MTSCMNRKQFVFVYFTVTCITILVMIFACMNLLMHLQAIIASELFLTLFTGILFGNISTLWKCRSHFVESLAKLWHGCPANPANLYVGHWNSMIFCLETILLVCTLNFSCFFFLTASIFFIVHWNRLLFQIWNERKKKWITNKGSFNN